jgi:hypothetical protein
MSVTRRRFLVFGAAAAASTLGAQSVAAAPVAPMDPPVPQPPGSAASQGRAPSTPPASAVRADGSRTATLSQADIDQFMNWQAPPTAPSLSQADVDRFIRGLAAPAPRTEAPWRASATSLSQEDIDRFMG